MLNVGILVFPFIEELDFIGPFEVLNYVNKIKEVKATMLNNI